MVIFLCNVESGRAQTDTPKLEVGPQFSTLKLNYNYRATEGSIREANDTWLGFGGRVTYNLNNNLAIEGTLEKFDTDVSEPLTFSAAAQPDVQGLFGIKAGVRKEKFGYFAKVRPGFTRYTEVFDCPAIDFSTCNRIRETSFSIDFGGVFEGYLSKRLMYRVDGGGITMRHRDTTLFFPGEPGTSAFQFPSQGFKKVSFKLSVGVGFRF